VGIERAEVRPGVELAFWRQGAGGTPLLLLHGWPETKRIWERNVGPLAEAGFEVIVPDLRGFGDSGLAPDGFYDLAAHARDMYALVHDTLGHDWCAACGGDIGGGVIQDLGLRFPGLVRRQVLFNTILPFLDELPPQPAHVTMAADYFVRQGTDADGLAEELDTPEKRRRYIATFYGSRFWAVPGAFAPEDVDRMTEPFADPHKLRAGFGNYEVAMRTIPVSERARFRERNPDETLVLHGPEDHVIWRDFPERCELVFENLVGPFVVPRAGHFLQWERAGLLNRTLAAFLRDLQK